MAHSFEDMVTEIVNAKYIFALSSDLPLIREGLTDLQQRLHAIEAQVKAQTDAQASLKPPKRK